MRLSDRLASFQPTDIDTYKACPIVKNVFAGPGRLHGTRNLLLHAGRDVRRTDAVLLPIDQREGNSARDFALHPISLGVHE